MTLVTRDRFFYLYLTFKRVSFICILFLQSIEYLSSAIEISETGGNTERLKQLYFERGNNYKDLNLLSEALEVSQINCSFTLC